MQQGKYLRVKNFWNYQNADVWKKSRTHPPWCKLFVHRDLELDQLHWEARLLWYELLAIATRYGNAFLSESKWIANEARMPESTVRKRLPELVKGGWLTYSDSGRRSRKILENRLEKISTRSRRRSNKPRGVDLGENVAGEANGPNPDLKKLKCPLCDHRERTEQRLNSHCEKAHNKTYAQAIRAELKRAFQVVGVDERIGESA